MGKDSEKGRYTTPEGSATWEYIATSCCSLLLLCFGFQPGWCSPSLSILTGPDTPIPLTSSDISNISAIMGIGYMIAPLFTMVLADKLGRKKALIVASVPLVLSWGLIAAAKDVTVIIMARFMGGLSMGLGLCIAPMYLGEIASPKLRGALGMVISIMMNSGILIMFVLVPCFSMQVTAYICFIVSALAIIVMWIVPESPYFLVMVGRLDEAEISLEKLRGKADIMEELDLIKKTLKEERTSINESLDEMSEDKVATRKADNSFKQLFRVAKNRKVLWINLLFVFVLQVGGYITVMLYCQVIIEAMNTGLSANVCTITVASLQLVANVLTVFVVDKVGRKPLIFFSGLTSGACFMVICIYYFMLEYTTIDVASYGIIAVCAMFAYIVFMNIGIMPLQTVVMSEIISAEVKALTCCLIGVVGGVLSTIVTKFYLVIATDWGYGHSIPFLGFTVITWGSTVIILKMLPETKGRTFLEIQRDLIK